MARTCNPATWRLRRWNGELTNYRLTLLTSDIDYSVQRDQVRWLVPVIQLRGGQWKVEWSETVAIMINKLADQVTHVHTGG